jgi:hypothetical protein
MKTKEILDIIINTPRELQFSFEDVTELPSGYSNPVVSLYIYNSKSREKDLALTSASLTNTDTETVDGDFIMTFTESKVKNLLSELTRRYYYYNIWMEDIDAGTGEILDTKYLTQGNFLVVDDIDEFITQNHFHLPWKTDQDITVLYYPLESFFEEVMQRTAFQGINMTKNKDLGAGTTNYISEDERTQFNILFENKRLHVFKRISTQSKNVSPQQSDVHILGQEGEFWKLVFQMAPDWQYDLTIQLREIIREAISYAISSEFYYMTNKPELGQLHGSYAEKLRAEAKSILEYRNKPAKKGYNIF